MTEPRAPRVDDARAKRIRARIRREGSPCHLCRLEIDYQAHHHDPRSFQVDHLWPVSLGGPEHDIDNCAASHRACNRARSDTIDAVAIATAARYGVHLKAKATTGKTEAAPTCAPAGQHCRQCTGTHDPAPGVSFVTSRCWWTP